MGEPFPVMVTGVGGGGHGEQILKALRLGKLPYRVVGTDADPNSTGLTRVDAGHRVPLASSPEYLPVILELCARHGIRALFHGTEPEMGVFSEQRASFERLGIYVPVNSPGVLRVCQNKIETVRFLREHGFPAPRSWAVDAPSALDEIDSFPVVLKPAVGGGGSANVFIAQQRDELLAFGHYLLKQYARVSIQEYVGTPDTEFTVGVLFAADGSLLNSIAVRRLITNSISLRVRVPNRSGRAELGSTLVISSGISQGEVGRWPEVTSQCERIAQALNPTAPINIQCRVVDGTVVPFEINPRFSGTTSIRALAGYNEPDVLIRRDVLGERIEDHFAYESCVVMRGLQEFVVRGSSS